MRPMSAHYVVAAQSGNPMSVGTMRQVLRAAQAVLEATNNVVEIPAITGALLSACALLSARGEERLNRWAYEQ